MPLGERRRQGRGRPAAARCPVTPATPHPQPLGPETRGQTTDTYQQSSNKAKRDFASNSAAPWYILTCSKHFL